MYAKFKVRSNRNRYGSVQSTNNSEIAVALRDIKSVTYSNVESDHDDGPREAVVLNVRGEGRYELNHTYEEALRIWSAASAGSNSAE